MIEDRRETRQQTETFLFSGRGLSEPWEGASGREVF